MREYLRIGIVAAAIALSAGQGCRLYAPGPKENLINERKATIWTEETFKEAGLVHRQYLASDGPTSNLELLLNVYVKTGTPRILFVSEDKLDLIVRQGVGCPQLSYHINMIDKKVYYANWHKNKNASQGAPLCDGRSVPLDNPTEESKNELIAALSSLSQQKK